MALIFYKKSLRLSTSPVAVVALVFYHGRQANVPPTIDLSEDPTLEIAAPGIHGLAAQVRIVNYQKISWAEIPNDRPASVLECCLKTHLDPQWHYLQQAMQRLQIWGGLSPNTFEEICRYILVQIQLHNSPIDVFYQILKLPYFTTKGDSKMTTLAEWIANTTPEMLQHQWMQEGRQEGRQEGLEQGQSLLMQRMFFNGMSIESIASATGYALEEVQRRLTKQ